MYNKDQGFNDDMDYHIFDLALLVGINAHSLSRSLTTKYCVSEAAQSTFHC